MTERHKKQLLGIGLVPALGIPVVLAAWIAVAHLGGLDVVTTCRLAGLSTMLLLGASIFAPLFLDHPREARLRGFVIVWFTMSVTFNLVWELPLVCFRSALLAVEVSTANLPKEIAWWGYTLSDAYYRQVTPFVVTIEIWWLLANAIAVAGLWLVRRGDATKGHLWLGVAGALQAYNASLYVGANGVMDHFSNIAEGSALAWVIYWGFNMLWTVAAIAGSVVAFHLVLARKEEAPASARAAAHPEDPSSEAPPAYATSR